MARGANLAAIHRDGVKVVLEDGREVSSKGAAAVGSAREAGPHDLVLLTVKAHQVADVAPELHYLLTERTCIVTMQNGIPWWYFQRHGGEFEGTPVRSADPDGTISRLIDPARIVGCVVYPAANLVAPGIIQVDEGRRFTLGELDGQTTPRIEAIARSFTAAGFKAPVTSDIRGELWLKVWGSMSFNPISALTRATLVDLCQFPLTRDLSAQMMSEGELIAKRLGVSFRMTVDRRIAGAEQVGAHKTSMLQDLEHGRPMEIEGLIGAVVELGRLTGTPTPHIDAVYACVSLLNRTVAAQRGPSEGARA